MSRTGMKRELEDVAGMVDSVLRDIPATRNDDTLLAWRIWETFFGIGESITLADLQRLPNFETIRRTRAKIQNELREYLPSDPVVRRRRGLEEEWRNAVSQMDLFQREDGQ